MPKKPMHKPPTPTQPELPLPRMAEPVVYVPAVRVPQPDGAVLFRPGKPVVLAGDDEIDTAEAARIIGVSQRRVQSMCDEGILREGTDWRRPGGTGNYKIRREAAIRVREGR